MIIDKVIVARKEKESRHLDKRLNLVIGPIIFILIAFIAWQVMGSFLYASRINSFIPTLTASKARLATLSPQYTSLVNAIRLLPQEARKNQDLLVRATTLINKYRYIFIKNTSIVEEISTNLDTIKTAWHESAELVYAIQNGDYKSTGATDRATDSLDEIGEVLAAFYRQVDIVDLAGQPGELKPAEIAFAYGDLANIHLQESPAHSIVILGNFEYMVCGEPGTLTAREQSVTNALKSLVKIFGYVSMGGSPLEDMAVLKEQVDRITAAGWYGVFIDQAGYDFGETRLRQNELVDYIHNQNLIVFMNAWFVDDVLGSKADQDHNPGGTLPHLIAGDWYLLESFLMSGSGYRDLRDSLLKYDKSRAYKKSLGINIASLSYKRDAAGWGEGALVDDIILSYLMTALYSFDGWWFSDALADDVFWHGDFPELSIGDSLISSIKPILSNLYIAETDRYIFTFDTSRYPQLIYQIYDKSSQIKLF